MKMSKLSKHQEQYERVKRYYKKFKDINEGLIRNEPSEFYVDTIYSFFIHCFHLKDWIKNDPAAALVAPKVENYIHRNLDLSICGDICIALKHLKNDEKHTPHSQLNPQFGKKSIKLHLGGEENGKFEMKMTIDTSSGPRDAFDIATKCIDAWDKFYSDNKLM